MAPQPSRDVLGAVAEMKALETRQVLRAKQPGERLRAVRAAIERGDAAYVGAVVNEEPCAFRKLYPRVAMVKSA